MNLIHPFWTGPARPFASAHHHNLSKYSSGPVRMPYHLVRPSLWGFRPNCGHSVLSHRSEALSCISSLRLKLTPLRSSFSTLRCSFILCSFLLSRNSYKKLGVHFYTDHLTSFFRLLGLFIPELDLFVILLSGQALRNNPFLALDLSRSFFSLG